MLINLSPKIYPPEAILNTCYHFIDKLYFSLDYNKKGDIVVSFTGKRHLSRKKELILKKDFLNELLYFALRYSIGKNNRKIREYIIGRALFLDLPNPYNIGADEAKRLTKDPLKIATTWEKKYRNHAYNKTK